MPLSLRQIENEIFENTVNDNSPMFLDDTREEETSEYLLYLYTVCEDCGSWEHTKDDHDRRTDDSSIIR